MKLSEMTGGPEKNPMEGLIKIAISQMGLSQGIGIQRIVRAWGLASGAASHTLNIYCLRGTLHVTLSSAMVRNHLSMNLTTIIHEMNRILSQDETYIMSGMVPDPIRKIILK